MKATHRVGVQIAIGTVLGLFIGIGLHGVVLSNFDGVRLLQNGSGQVVTCSPTTDLKPNVSPSLAAAICASSACRHDAVSASAHPWIYADAENYYVVDHFPSMIIPCSYYSRLLGCRISRKDGKMFNSHTEQWEPRGFINMPTEEAERLLSTNMTCEAVLTMLGNPLSVFGEDGGLRHRIDGNPCFAWRYLCRDGSLFVVLSQSVVVGIQTNDTACAL